MYRRKSQDSSSSSSNRDTPGLDIHIVDRTILNINFVLGKILKRFKKRKSEQGLDRQ